MMIKYAIALAIVLIAAAFAAWAFLPARHLPGNRQSRIFMHRCAWDECPLLSR